MKRQGDTITDLILPALLAALGAFVAEREIEVVAARRLVVLVISAHPPPHLESLRPAARLVYDFVQDRTEDGRHAPELHVVGELPLRAALVAVAAA